MNADVILKKKEDAVSPVIGVMLMLVVTIVIAAVVAAFAGGLGSDVEMAPTAALDFDVYASDKTVKVEHLSGEILIPNDITIKVSDNRGTLGQVSLSKGSGVGTSFAPGSTTTVALEMGTYKEGESTSTYTLEAGNYVTVTVLSNGKHVVAKKDVVVKA